MNFIHTKVNTLRGTSFFFLVAVLVGLVFSYYPLLSLGQLSGVNIDISLLYIFSILSIVVSAPLVVRSLPDLWTHTAWKVGVGFASFTSLSILWSPNIFRATLTAIFLWVMIALASLVIIHSTSLAKKRVAILKWVALSFAMMALLAGWQLIGDALGVLSTYTLLTDNYRGDVFGFARPTGFALEPQFFGSLLIAPLAWLSWKYLKDTRDTRLTPALIGIGTLLILSLSRGALIASLITLVILMISVRPQKNRVISLVGYGLCSLLLALSTIYGLASLRQSDTISGYQAVKGSVQHLSLGTIALPNVTSPKQTRTSTQKATPSSPAPNYIPASTTSRLSMSERALQLWQKDVPTFFFGVGIGGFGASIDKDAPGQVVNNYYFETIAELGIIGFGLFVSFLGSIVYVLIKRKQWLLFAILSGYLLQLCFFSGNANIIHVWIVLGLSMAVGFKKQSA
jgi:hypothetical protein